MSALWMPVLCFSLAASIWPGNPVVSHDFHLSKCLIEHRKEEKSLQITVYIFLDDLEEALRQQGADKLFLCSENENEQAEKYLYRYLQKTISFKVNNKAVNYEFVGKERSDDLLAVWCYLEITGVTEVSAITVRNDLLMEIYDDQKNIINIHVANDKKGFFLFEKGRSIETAYFK